MFDKFQQYNETDPLKKIILGRIKGYRKVDDYVQHVNEAQKSGLPSEEKLSGEFSVLADLLESHGVQVLRPEYVGKFVYDQLTPRDIGVTIGEKFLICNMAKSSRRYEAAGIFKHILSMHGPEPVILIPPAPDALLEGGDIIVDKEHIFVGLTQRTNQKGVAFLKETFEPEFKVVSVPCKSFSGENEVLHLDCVFNPVGSDHALIYPAGFQYVPESITDSYKLIEITTSEQQALATNILSIDKSTVVNRDHPECKRVNELMRKAGIKVHTIAFNAAPSTGGSFRCCTLPLHREYDDQE